MKPREPNCGASAPISSEDTCSYRDQVRCMVERKMMPSIQQQCRNYYTERIAGAAISNHKAHFNYVQWKETLIKKVGVAISHQ